MTEQTFLTHEVDGHQILEIKKAQQYAVPSKTNPGLYRLITLCVNKQNEIELDCDCESGFYRGIKKQCRHKKMMLTVLKRLASSQQLTSALTQVCS